MLRGVLVAATLLLASCSPSAVFYPDHATVVAAPELIRAWNSLPFWEKAKTQILVPGQELSLLQKDLDQNGAAFGEVLISFPLPSGQLELWRKAFPRISWGLIGTSNEGAVTFIPAVAGGWHDLAQNAAKHLGPLRADGNETLVFVAEGESPENLGALQEGWSSGGGRDRLTVVPLPADSQTAAELAKKSLPTQKAVFLLAGGLNSVVLPLVPADVLLFTEFPSGGLAARSAVSLSLDENGLGETILKALKEKEKKPVFLRLKTLDNSR